MSRFTAENTQGYSVDDLRELNRRFAARLAVAHPDDASNKSYTDYLAERVLAEFDGICVLTHP